MNTEEVAWHEEEFGNVDLGDSRLNWRLHEVAGKLATNPAASINSACDDWSDTKAAYRLFENKRVTAEKVLTPHQERTVMRIEREEVVLALSDTSFLNYTHHPSKKGTGSIGSTENLRGYVLHHTLAVTEKGLPLGILDMAIWAREEEDKSLSKDEKKNRPIEEKESYKWLASFNQCQKLRPPQCRLVSVGDREADVYELFVIAQEALTAASALGGFHHLLVRATQSRSLADETEVLKSRAKVQAQPVAGKLSVTIPAQRGEPERTALVTVRYGTLKLKPPKRFKKKSPTPLPSVTLGAILVVEENPPPNIKALNWFLLTNFPVLMLNDAVRCIGWYRSRWHIEVYFKVLKSGCTIEDCRLETNERLFPYIALMSVIAWRLYWLTHINRHQPDLPCTHVLADHEWKALYATIHRTTSFPEKVPSVGESIRWIARLGGFLARKGDGDPGVTTIWRGWTRLQDKSDTWLLFQGK